MQPPGTSPANIDSPPVLPHPDRRRRVRHRVNLPAYASLNQGANGQSLDLNEIIDISEEGMRIQTCSPLEVGRAEDFCIDLAETKAFIQATGRAVWSDQSGRAGIYFGQIPDLSLCALREWLVVNAGAVGVEQVQDSAAEPDTTAVEVAPTAVAEEFEAPAYADYTSILSAVGAVRREVESLGADLEAALHLVARRALAFTQASGAAIALTEQQEMICRATAGPDAPPLGAQLQIGAGFSGECVRTGMLLRCDDSETDPRVDRESCRALAVRSMVAVPIRAGDTVIGLLEVFSPEPDAFQSDDEIALKRLADIIPEAIGRASSPPANVPPPSQVAVDDEFPVETPADLGFPQISRSRKLLLICAAITVGLVVLRVIGPWDSSRVSGTDVTFQEQSKAAVRSDPARSPAPDGLEGLRRLADAGDGTAQFAVGARYATGEGVPLDYAEAARWFTKAAEQGNVMAQATLSTYYWAGRGVPPDPIKAYFWSVVAKAGGDETSKDLIAVLTSRLSQEQVSVVQQQADNWIKQHGLPGPGSAARQ